MASASSEPFYRSLEQWAAIRPDAPVLIDGARTLSYADWNTSADRLAAGFLARGLKANDVIALRTRNRAEWAIATAATGKIGARLLIQNWKLTPAESRYILENAKADAFICDDADAAPLAAALQGLKLKLKATIDNKVDGFEAFDALFADDAPQLYARSHPPLIVYTSGTTGFPKGVEMPKPLPPLSSTRREAPEAEDGIGLVNMPVHHGSGPNQIWNHLMAGRRIVMMRRFDAEETLRLIEQHGITHWSGVPTMYKRMAGLADGVIAGYDLSSLKAITIGAAPCPWPLKEWILDTFGEILSEGYGSTETGMITNMPADRQRQKPGSSGLPFPNVEIEIRDAAGARLPPNAEGEIWVRSPMTIEAYVNSPRLGGDERDAAGFFKVGDIGRVDEDGFLFLTDRAKDLIISGGVNIYPAEIEAQLLAHPSVQDTAVIGAPHDEFGEEVLAYIELKPGRATTPEDLMQHLAPRLASYKLPRRIEFIAELPRNTMGKILKRVLREPLWQGRERHI